MNERIAGRLVFLGLPAFNEAAAIRPLFERIRQAQDALLEAGLVDGLRVVLYDDGSTDGTADAARHNASDLHLSVLTPSCNGGLGIALQGIVTFFLEEASESDVLVIMDCDDTHDPRQMAQLLEQMVTQGDDVVVASRYRAGAVISGVPATRQILSLGFAFLVKAVLPIRGVRDYSCGYRAYAYAPLKAAAHDGRLVLDEPGFAAMPEILIRLRSRGWRFGEIPLHLAYDQRQTESKMRAWHNTVRLMTCVTRWRFAPPNSRTARQSRGAPVEPLSVEILPPKVCRDSKHGKRGRS
jgi:dolichol-phosphate mannosyltransferase